MQYSGILIFTCNRNLTFGLESILERRNSLLDTFALGVLTGHTVVFKGLRTRNAYCSLNQTDKFANKFFTSALGNGIAGHNLLDALK